MSVREATLTLIAAATGRPRTTLQRWAHRQAWPYRERPTAARGRPERVYRTAHLPAEVRQALADAPADLIDAPPRRLQCSRPGCRRLVEGLGLCGAHRRRLRAGRPMDAPLIDRAPAPSLRMVRRGLAVLSASVPSVRAWCAARGAPKNAPWRLVSGELTGRAGRSRAVALALERIGREGRIRPSDRPSAPAPPAERGEALLREIHELRLPGMPRTKAGLRKRATREGWPRRAGGVAFLYRLDGLPADVRGALDPPPASPIGEPPAKPMPPEGHPSRYRTLKRPRLPDWAREGDYSLR